MSPFAFIAITVAALFVIATFIALWLALTGPARREDQQEREAADEFRRNMVHRAGRSGGP